MVLARPAGELMASRLPGLHSANWTKLANQRRKSILNE